MMWDGTEHCATMTQGGGPTRATSVEKTDTRGRKGSRQWDRGKETKFARGRGWEANCKKKRGEETEKVYKKFVSSGESLYLHHLDTYFHNLNQINYGR